MTSLFGRTGSASRTAIAAAVCAACAPLPAQAADQAPASEVQASIAAGAGASSGDRADRAFFGQYNGLRDADVYGLLDVNYSRRYAATGTWIELMGTDLGVQTRELDFLWKRQGQWRINAHYGELVRRDPYTVNTQTSGFGTPSPQLNYMAGGPDTGSDVELKTKRRAAGLSAAKLLAPAFELVASFTVENKEGTARYGNGLSCPSSAAPTCGPTTLLATGSAVLFLGEPVKSTHSQAQLRLNYGAGDLSLNGGYYGSFYNNRNSTLNPLVPSTLNNPVGDPLPASAGLQGLLQAPLALAPDNSYHAIDLGGAYAFSDTVRGNFKLAYAQARQDQDFAGSGLTGGPPGQSNLGGKIDTTLAQFGIHARPLPKLTLVATYRFRDDKDKTPIAAYNVIGPVTSTNYSIGRTVNAARLDATYLFPVRVSATAGLSYESIDRDPYTPTSAAAGVSALRRKTEETGVLVELRRSLTRTFSGAISARASRRDGSNWLRPNAGTGVTEVGDPAADLPADAIYSPTLADRDRTRLRLNGTWLPAEGLTLQISAETGKDDYDTPSRYSVRRIQTDSLSLDADYLLSEQWQLNGYVSQTQQKLDQARPGGYVIGFKDKGFNAGVGFRGRPVDAVEIGGQLSLMDNTGVHLQDLDTVPAPGSAQLLAATGGLPDITFRLAEIRLFGSYAFSARSSVRLNAGYQRVKYDDWTYRYQGTPFLFGDNTTLSFKQVQDVVHIGASYVYTWR